MSACYRKVSPDIWDDEWFIEQDDATRNLWWIILTGKQVLPIPGLQNIGPGALAEKLRRTSSSVAELFSVLIEQKKIEFDDKVQVLRVPNAPKFNVPDNPNQVLGWWKAWQRLPQSTLKFKHIDSLRDAVKGATFEADTKKNSAFFDAWNRGFGTISEPLLNGLETVSDRARASGAGSMEQRTGSMEVTVPISSVRDVFDYWKGKLAPRAKLDAKRTAIIEKALKTYSVDELRAAVDGTCLDPWRMGENPDNKKYIGVELIFRNSEKIEPMIELARSTVRRPPNPTEAAALRAKQTELSLEPSVDALSPEEHAAAARNLKQTLSGFGLGVLQ